MPPWSLCFRSAKSPFALGPPTTSLIPAASRGPDRTREKGFLVLGLRARDVQDSPLDMTCSKASQRFRQFAPHSRRSVAGWRRGPIRTAGYDTKLHPALRHQSWWMGTGGAMIRRLHDNEPGDFWLREDCDWCDGHKCLEHHGPAAPLPAGSCNLRPKRLASTHACKESDSSSEEARRKGIADEEFAVLLVGVAGRQLGSRLSLSTAVGYLRGCSCC